MDAGYGLIARTLRNELRTFGLTALQADAYVELLAHGAGSTGELAARLKRPASKIDDSARRLVKFGVLSERQTGSGRTVWYVPHPETAWNAKAADLVWVRSTTLDRIANLPASKDQATAVLQRRCEMIGGLASRVGVGRTSPSSQRKFATSDPDVLAHLTSEAISEATDQVRAVSRSPRLPHVSLIYQTIQERLAAGIPYRRIADLQEVIDHGLAVIRRDVYGDGVQLRIVDPGKVARSFYVVDKRYLVLQSADKFLEPHSTSIAGALIRNAGTITRYRRGFDALWQKAADAKLVVDALQSQADQLLTVAADHLPLAEQNWLDELIRWGQFSSFANAQGWPESKDDRITTRAINLGLVEMNLHGRPVPRYDRDGIDLDRLLATELNAVRPPCTGCWEPERRCRCTAA